MSLEYLEPVSTEVLESIEGLPDHVLGKNMPADFQNSREQNFIKQWPIFNLNFWMASANVHF